MSKRERNGKDKGKTRERKGKERRKKGERKWKERGKNKKIKGKESSYLIFAALRLQTLGCGDGL